MLDHIGDGDTIAAKVIFEYPKSIFYVNIHNSVILRKQKNKPIRTGWQWLLIEITNTQLLVVKLNDINSSMQKQSVLKSIPKMLNEKSSWKILDHI